MKKNLLVAALLALSAGAALAQENETRREAYLRQQAYGEMQRVAGQVDVLQQNQEELAGRVAKLEGGNSETAALRAEIAALRAELDRLRAEMQAQRGEIIRDLTGKLKQMQRELTPSTPPLVAQPPRSAAGPHLEYVVASGDTLSLIAQAFGTTVGRIKEMNGLKGDMVRIGQKIKVPKK